MTRRRSTSVPVFHLIPHTHWDREWYLPRAVFRSRLVPMIDDLLMMLERHRALRFTLDGQTVLIEDFLGVRPTAARRVARLVARGQLAIGPWHVLADELTASPTSLRRNLALGMRDAELFGGAMRVLYSPDAFGHPAFLPVLAAEVGIRWGVLWRGLAGHPTEGPDLYRWRGPGRRTILLHHLPPEGYEIGADLPGTPAAGLRAKWRELRDRLVARSVTRHIAVPVGADHHAAHPALPTLASRLGTVDPDHRFRYSRWEDYFAAVERERVRAPILTGELRSRGTAWSLQGVHGSRARLKRMHARVEANLERVVEPLVRLTRPRHRDDRIAALWRELVKCQFHDTLAGTVADEVANEQVTRLASVDAACRELVRSTVHERIGAESDHDLVLCNPTPRPHRGVLIADLTFFRRDVLVGPPDGRRPRVGPGAHGFALERRDGTAVPMQMLHRASGLERVDQRFGYPDLDEVDRIRVAFDPGLARSRSIRRLRVVERRGRVPTGGPRVVVGPRWIANRYVRVEIRRFGRVDVVDKRTRQRYAGLLGLVDERDRGDLYTPSIHQGRRPRPATRRPEILAEGPLVGALAVGWRLRSAGSGWINGRTVVELRADSPAVRCRVELDNHARDHRLRVRCPVGLPGPAVAGTGEGVVRRPVAPTGSAGSLEAAVATAPARDFVAVGGARRGLAILTTGHFEYELTSGGDLMLTLLRSVDQLARADLPERPGLAGWPTPTPGALEPGRHVVTFALMPSAGRSMATDRLDRAAREIASPPVVLELKRRV